MKTKENVCAQNTRLLLMESVPVFHSMKETNKVTDAKLIVKLFNCKIPKVSTKILNNVNVILIIILLCLKEDLLA